MNVERRLLMEGIPGSWEKDVCNPGVIKDKDGYIELLYRGVTADNTSNIGYAKVKDGVVIERSKNPIIRCGSDQYNKKGVEDPRITKLENTYYVLCTVFDGTTPRIEVFYGDSILNLKSGGIISPCITLGEAIGCVVSEKYKQSLEELSESYSRDLPVPDKDAVLFPEKIDGKFVLLHRIHPAVQMVKVESLEETKSPDFWKAYFNNVEKYELIWPQAGAIKIGAGAPPIKVGSNWLLFFHEVSKLPNDGLVYKTEAALLDNNLKLIERTKEPVCEPAFEFEKVGIVPNVIFTTGAIERKDEIELYSGAADSKIVYEKISKKRLSELLPSLKWSKLNK